MGGTDGGCVTLADCNPGYICTSDHGGGTCERGPYADAGACSKADSSCGGATDAPCCGVCIDSGCRKLADLPCQNYPGAPCQDDTGCCVLLHCLDQTCQPLCGQENALCNPDAGNSDCCIALGYTCQPTVDGGTVYQCNNQSFFFLTGAGSCAAVCKEGGAPECQLGSTCNPLLPRDPCIEAGLVCDPAATVCTRPTDELDCVPGGPPCTADPYFLNSSATLVCTLAMGAFDQPVCVQLCQDTSDCVDPSTSCCTSCTPPICESTYLVPGKKDCSPLFGSCNAQGTHDGLCAPFSLSESKQVTWCFQALLDGGGPGSSCNTYASRQNPALCDTSDWCIGGICVPICNASTDAGSQPYPNCPGPGMQSCVSVSGYTPMSPELGYCRTLCDLIGGGGCVVQDGGAAQTCLPNWLFGLDDDVIGSCAGLVDAPLAFGASCVQPLGALTVCAAGSICFNEPSGGNYCDLICLLNGGWCPGGGTCQPVGPGFGISGVCFTGQDGGTDGG